jgi:hypothetical protein
MSNFVQHHPCPKCGSRNNLGEWDDGHKHCFGCGYYVPSNITSAKSVERLLSPVINSGYGELPSDVTEDIPREPLAWLMKYSLTKQEISENNFLWSSRNEMLIVPYRENGKLVLWQGRYFPSRTPKAFTDGRPDSVVLRPALIDGVEVPDGRIVVVEDPISAIKVNRVCSATPLLGSSLSMHKSVLLSRTFSHLTLWLDYDKISSMIKFWNQYKVLFRNVDIITKERDPKEYTTDEIKEILK